MTFLFGWLLKFLTSGVIKDVAAVFVQKSNNATDEHKADVKAATDIVVAQMNAEIEARKAQAAMSSRHDWIVSCLGGAFVFHIFMIVLDSVFHLNWNVSALPAPMDQWEGQIVLALCCVGPTTSIVNKIVTKVWK